VCSTGVGCVLSRFRFMSGCDTEVCACMCELAAGLFLDVPCVAMVEQSVYAVSYCSSWHLDNAWLWCVRFVLMFVHVVAVSCLFCGCIWWLLSALERSKRHIFAALLVKVTPGMMFALWRGVVLSGPHLASRQS
jgi:hypothetical protein